jgi:hypothetical protein
MNKTVLEEAAYIVETNRQDIYGDAGVTAELFAKIASAATGLTIIPEHLPLLMISLKLARGNPYEWNRDKWVDIAGYSRVAELIENGE